MGSVKRSFIAALLKNASATAEMTRLAAENQKTVRKIGSPAAPRRFKNIAEPAAKIAESTASTA